MWRKAWIDTRWRFLAGLALIGCAALFTVLSFPEVRALAGGANPDSALARQLAPFVGADGFQAFIRASWFQGDVSRLGILFAVLLGAGGPFSPASRGGSLYTLSLPAPRRAFFISRAAVGLGELAIIVLLPSLALTLLAPLAGESYGAGAAMVGALCVFVACSFFFALTMLLSAVFDDLWPPPLIALCFAAALALLFRAPLLADFNPLRATEASFAAFALALSAVAAATMLVAAQIRTERRDY